MVEHGDQSPSSISTLCSHLLLLVPVAHRGRQRRRVQPAAARVAPEVGAAVHGGVHARQHLCGGQEAGGGGAGRVLQPVGDPGPGHGQREGDDGQQQQEHDGGHGPEQALAGEARARAQVLLELLAPTLQPVHGAGLLEALGGAVGRRGRALLGRQELLLVRVRGRHVLGVALLVLERLPLGVGVAVRGHGVVHGQGRGVAVGLLLLVVFSHVTAGSLYTHHSLSLHSHSLATRRSLSRSHALHRAAPHTGLD